MHAPGPVVLGRILTAESMSEAARDNPLARYFLKNKGRLIHKWEHYFEIYHRHLERFRSRSPVVLEIGISQGGSLQMWRDYFGRGAQIVGVDIDPRCKQFEDAATPIMIGDQANPAFLAGIRDRFPRIDIVIDDGGHTMEQQITTLRELYPHVHPQGVYLCEDVHTSYMAKWGGGVRRDGTFIEFAKTLIDTLHAWYHVPEGGEIDSFTLGTFGISFYDSVVVIEKRPMPQPRQLMSGKPSF